MVKECLSRRSVVQTYTPIVETYKFWLCKSQVSEKNVIQINFQSLKNGEKEKERD